VADIASEAGFVNFSHFAKLYRASFGESPTTTIQRSPLDGTVRSRSGTLKRAMRSLILGRILLHVINYQDWSKSLLKRQFQPQLLANGVRKGQSTVRFRRGAGLCGSLALRKIVRLFMTLRGSWPT